MRLCSCCESAASPKLKSFGSGILEHLVVGLGDHAAQRLRRGLQKLQYFAMEIRPQL